MKQYIDLLDKIRRNGTLKPAARENMPNTIGLSHGIIEHDLADGFPLLTTKKVYYKAIVVELLWFLRGDTNIKFLVDNGCNIWNKDAYRWYLTVCKKNEKEPFYTSIEDFINAIKTKSELKQEYKGLDYKIGDLGKVYGHQWRNQNGVDQIADIIKSLKNAPFSRYHILDAWNKAEFSEMALPPCHLLYQFTVRQVAGRKYLDLNMYQRSCDTFLGVPFNIASMATLLQIMADVSHMYAGRILWIGGDTHVYENHLTQVDEQLMRSPTELPSLAITKSLNSLEDVLELEWEDFNLQNYNPQPAIKAKLSAGLKED